MEIERDNSGVADMRDQDGAILGQMTWERVGKTCTITGMDYNYPQSGTIFTLPFDNSEEWRP